MPDSMGYWRIHWPSGCADADRSVIVLLMFPWICLYINFGCIYIFTRWARGNNQPGGALSGSSFRRDFAHKILRYIGFMSAFRSEIRFFTDDATDRFPCKKYEWPLFPEYNERSIGYSDPRWRPDRKLSMRRMAGRKRAGTKSVRMSVWSREDMLLQDQTHNEQNVIMRSAKKGTDSRSFYYNIFDYSSPTIVR